MNKKIENIEYWKDNAEEDYIKTPISVLKYISELEELMNTEQKLPMHLISDILSYEVNSTWWASKISNKYLQKIAGNYFAWKVRTKHNRYLVNNHWKLVLSSSR